MRRHLSLKTQGMNGLRDPLQASLPLECPPKLPLSLLNSKNLFPSFKHGIVLCFISRRAVALRSVSPSSKLRHHSWLPTSALYTFARQSMMTRWRTEVKERKKLIARWKLYTVESFNNPQSVEWITVKLEWCSIGRKHKAQAFQVLFWNFTKDRKTRKHGSQKTSRLFRFELKVPQLSWKLVSPPISSF